MCDVQRSHIEFAAAVQDESALAGILSDAHTFAGATTGGGGDGVEHGGVIEGHRHVSAVRLADVCITGAGYRKVGGIIESDGALGHVRPITAIVAGAEIRRCNGRCVVQDQVGGNPRQYRYRVPPRAMRKQ